MIRLQGRKAVVLGGINGLLGQALVQALEAEGAVVAAAGRSQVDVTDENDLDAYFERVDPEMVFNAVAYTAVDQAEDEPAVAALLNAEVPAILGRLCQKRGILLVHYSTDFVFGCAEETPRREEDIPSPASVYGRTKLDGEQALLALGYDNLLILRTAWLFGPGKTNFVHKILGFAATRDELTVVHDQAGSPTFTPDLAAYSLDLIRHGARGLFHVTNSG
ncbi:MAG: NAD(P)-dependent oxidoreductase, partial [Proteobacteria bacterium]|nr:NAD(P)-dependent oxidoreductase [Pseudomonadota bacterium]MBU1612232.1 NAD(P)-dependent oxidoreductase [Pseudomonadota bacterium]